MTILEKKLEEFKRVTNEFERLRNAILDTGIAEFEFKQNLYDHAAVERELGKVSAAVFGGWKFASEPDYEKNYLMPILKNLTDSPEYIEENVELLTDFAISISYSEIDGVVNTQAHDYHTAVVIFRALLANAMKRENIYEHIRYTRLLSETLSKIGYTSSILEWHDKAIECLNTLFEKIPEADYENLLPKECEEYALCKWQWLWSHLQSVKHDDSDPEIIMALCSDSENFLDKAENLDPHMIIEYKFTLLNYRMQLGGACAGAQVRKEFAEQILLHMKENMFSGIWEILCPENNVTDDRLRIDNLGTYYPATDRGHLRSWAVLSLKLGYITKAEYYRFLSTLAEAIMSLPWKKIRHDPHPYLWDCAEAVTFFCHNYGKMKPEEKTACETTAKNWIDWILSLPFKNRIASVSGCGNSIWKTATRSLPVNERAEVLLKLTTVSTYAHTNLVAEMALDLARPLMKKLPEKFAEMFPGLSEREIMREIYTAMRLHDIGKMEISGTISQVVRSLFDEEFAEIKSHPTRALHYLEAPEFACARACACWHHEHFDGKGGYPHDYTDPDAEKFRFIAQLCIFADCYSSAMDKYKSAYQAEKDPATMIEELVALSKPEATEKFRKKEGSVWFNPIFIETLLENPALLKKYSDKDTVMDWIEKAYYQAHLVFQPQLNATEKPALPQEPFNLENDKGFQVLKLGTTDNTRFAILRMTECLFECGRPQITVIPNPCDPQKRAMLLSDRVACYASVYISNKQLDWDLDAFSYTIRISGTAPPGTGVELRALNSPYHCLVSADVTPDGNYTMQTTVSTKILSETEGGLAQFDRGFIIQTAPYTENSAHDFTIHEIVIAKV